MGVISFDVGGAKNLKLVENIALRTLTVYFNVAGERWPDDKKTLEMDLCATHANGCPMDFEKLLSADTTNFLHDVVGIRNHIDRSTGKLKNCFVPRCAK